MVAKNAMWWFLISQRLVKDSGSDKVKQIFRIKICICGQSGGRNFQKSPLPIWKFASVNRGDWKQLFNATGKMKLSLQGWVVEYPQRMVEERSTLMKLKIMIDNDHGWNVDGEVTLRWIIVDNGRGKYRRGDPPGDNLLMLRAKTVLVSWRDRQFKLETGVVRNFLKCIYGRLEERNNHLLDSFEWCRNEHPKVEPQVGSDPRWKYGWKNSPRVKC